MRSCFVVFCPDFKPASQIREKAEASSMAENRFDRVLNGKVDALKDLQDILEMGARAYDLVALKVWGDSTALNFPMHNYEKDLEEMKYYSKNEIFFSLRRNGKGFAKGASIYRGVSRNSDFKKWQARFGKGKDLGESYLGTFGGLHQKQMK
ncbi:hypothetical protein V6N13_107856 [Hibiscus sabdariffa]